MSTDFAGDDVFADVRASMGETADAPAVETPVREAPEAPVPEAKPADVPQNETPEQKRVRDEAGRFAKSQETGQTDPANPVAATPPEETSRPPHTLKATLKAQWASLPADVRSELERVEREAQQAKNEWQPKGERLNKFEAIIAPHRDRLQLAQQDEFGYVQALIKADEMLRTNPQQAIVQIASLYGINLGQPNVQPPQQQPQTGLSPEQVQAQVHQAVQAQLAREREEQAKAQVTSEWESFRTSADHPYAENVKMHMAALLREGAAQDLQSAYEQACWANPEVRTLLIAQQQPQAPKVQPVGLSVTGARGNAGHVPQSNGSSGSIEDDIRAAMQEVSGRV